MKGGAVTPRPPPQDVGKALLMAANAGDAGEVLGLLAGPRGGGLGWCHLSPFAGHDPIDEVLDVAVAEGARFRRVVEVTGRPGPGWRWWGRGLGGVTFSKGASYRLLP